MQQCSYDFIGQCITAVESAASQQLSQHCHAELLQRIKQMTSAVETVSDENSLLRQQSGITDTKGLDLAGVRLAKVTSCACPCLAWGGEVERRRACLC